MDNWKTDDSPRGPVLGLGRVEKGDAARFTFKRYRKTAISEISDEVLPVGTVVRTLEGDYTCGEPSRLAKDVSGNVYPIAVSVFDKSYVPG